jgi:hydroxymethylglutaryl-CoA reductase (NADPH)
MRKDPEPDEPAGELPPRTGAVELVPRLKHQGYDRELVAERRRWLEEKSAGELRHVGSFSISSDKMRGNVENPVGAAQVPLGVAGPLRLHGEHANGVFYVPMATTEGALVRSYERGMVTLTKAGGAVSRVHVDENRVSPIFPFAGVEEARAFCRSLPHSLPEIRRQAEETTRHGKLLRLECQPVGRQVIVNFCFSTGDAHGMNMIVRATDRACRWIVDHTAAERYQIFSGYNSEKRASGALLAGGKGKKVTAGARIPGRVLSAYLHVDVDQMTEMWRHTVSGHLQAGALGYNGHYANGLTAVFIACGQDVANVANSAVGITTFEPAGDGDLYASVTLPSLTVATVGGGTALGTARECLEVMDCAGPGRALKLAEIVAATILAGELSMGAAIASGEFVAAHEAYGRNRPEPAAQENGE